MEQSYPKDLSQLVCTVHTSISELDEKEWDRLVPQGSGFQCYKMLQFVETQGLCDWPPRYFCFRDRDNKLVAHFVAYLIRTSLAIFSKGVIRTTIDYIRKIWPNFLNPLTLECGWPISPGLPLCIDDTYKNKTTEMLRVLSQLAIEEAKRCHIHIIVMRDFYEEHLDMCSEIGRQQYVKIQNLPTAILPISWTNFEHYMGSLRSRFRAKVRRGLQIACNAGLTAVIRDDFIHDAPDLAKEWQNVNQYASEYARENLSPSFYAGIGSASEHKVKILEILQQGQRVAHAVFYCDSDVLRWLFFGRHHAGHKDGAYFLVIAELIKIAIEQNMKWLEMGLTTYSPKTDFGAQLHPLWALVHFRYRGFNKLLPPLIKILNSEPQRQDRQAFRDVGSDP